VLDAGFVLPRNAEIKKGREIKREKKEREINITEDIIENYFKK